jgi:hypothetical protein
MLVTMLLSHVGNGVVESVLAVAHQGTTTDHQDAIVNIKVPSPAVKVPQSTVRVPPPTAKVPSMAVKMPLIL